MFFIAIALAQAFRREVAHLCFCTLPISVLLYRAAYLNRLAFSWAKILMSRGWVMCEDCNGRITRLVLWVYRELWNLPVRGYRVRLQKEGVISVTSSPVIWDSWGYESICPHLICSIIVQAKYDLALIWLPIVCSYLIVPRRHTLIHWIKRKMGRYLSQKRPLLAVRMQKGLHKTSLYFNLVPQCYVSMPSKRLLG
jgi:hypothetical protein